ncbi:hypothetical protein FGO68_gene17613 [Halteria grandinella]|uniref:Uncharacterized protein n=1 Tax=Halteria grandinella TaxID=5974 RepID=A0A8J8SZI5_HALGN|nr:hypothetical protein FGO68_gene17613 [Halteria grandinella]
MYSDKIVSQLKGNPVGQYDYTAPGQVPSEVVEKLIEYTEAQYKLSPTKEDDFKYQLLKKELIQLIGQDIFDKLASLFGVQVDEILLRRCEAHGKFINFHTDVSKKTLQVALNDNYEGGKLVYLTEGRVFAPERPTGSITIHSDDIVHGVTKLESGVRYGLFLLNKNN